MRVFSLHLFSPFESNIETCSLLYVLRCLWLHQYVVVIFFYKNIILLYTLLCNFFPLKNITQTLPFLIPIYHFALSLGPALYPSRLTPTDCLTQVPRPMLLTGFSHWEAPARDQSTRERRQGAPSLLSHTSALSFAVAVSLFDYCSSGWPCLYGTKFHWAPIICVLSLVP